MKVSNQNPNAVNNTKLGKTQQTSSEQVKDAKSQKGVSAGDLKGSAQVDLSPQARQIQKAKELATPSADVDEAKVARLQKMIDEGNYKVDADAIAERMLGEHMMMS